MAANVQVDEGSDKTIATFEVGGVHYQCMILCDSVAGKVSPLPVDATYGIPVDVKRSTPIVDVCDKVLIGGAEYDVKTVAVNATASGENTILAATTGKRWRILSISVWSDTGLAMNLNDGTGTLIEAMTVVSGGSVQIAPPHGYVCQCGGTNRPIKMNLSTTGNVRGIIQYVELIS